LNKESAQGAGIV